ncbi:TPA: hypothetical protein DEP58_00480 [Patescibacteria group bacterium]|nr:MAG: hypothetical protein UU98_C0026G0018 [Parcubacteria group bacterium GW2011_GWD2_42_14]HCC04764.1 hypothetical protein [Patescibacteria group bacterium]
MKINFKNKTRAGFSLVEMIVYIALLTIFTSGLVFVVVSLFESKTHLTAREELAYTSTITLEKITREIRRSQSVDLFTSTIGFHPGKLTLEPEDTSAQPVTIYAQGGRVFLQEGSSTPSPLSSASVFVSNLVFTHMSNPTSDGVLVELTAEKNSRGATTTKNYRTFVVLDAS